MNFLKGIPTNFLFLSFFLIPFFILQILEKIGRHFPEFIDPFVIRLFGLLPRVHGEFKTIALQV